ncbi:CD225/dispanin family protein, partial [Actinomadura darangshiensis]
GYSAPPPNHLAWAIATTILCCLPAGIVSIVYAAQVNSKWMSGDHAGAHRASNNAKTWAIVSAVVGVIVGVIYFFVAMANSGT